MTRGPGGCWWSAEPRNRDRRFAFAADLADIIVSYIEGYYSSAQTVPGGRGQEDRTRFADAPQLLVPNPACIGFVRCSAGRPGSAGHRANTR